MTEKEAIEMRLVLELAILAIIVLLAVVARAFLVNLEDDAFDAELTEVSNQRARMAGGITAQ